MADKNTLQKHDKAISTLEVGVENLQISLAENRASMSSMDSTLVRLNKSNEELKKSLSELVLLLKKDPPPRTHEGSLRDGEGSSNHVATRSTPHGKSTMSPNTPTRFGTVNPAFILDETGKVMNPTLSASASVNQEISFMGGHGKHKGLTIYPDKPAVTLQSTQLGPTPSNQYYPHPYNPYQIYGTNPIYSAGYHPYFALPQYTNSTTATPLSINTTPQYSHHPFHTQLPPHPQVPPTHVSHNPTASIHQWVPFDKNNSFYKPPKVDFPKFEGQDPRSWISKCDKYFQLNPSLDARAKVICATLYLEGDADVWYRSLEEEKPNLQWPEFVELVCNRFSKVGYENLVGKFNKLMQRGSVEDYITQFDELRSYVMTQEGHHRESYYVDTFISGLKEEISQSLYNSKPSSLQEARNLARGQEYLLGVLDKRYKASNKTYNTGNSSKSNGFTFNKSTAPPANQKLGEKKVYNETKRLTLEELNDKKRRGICFHCDEKFIPGHDCKKKKLYLIMEERDDSECKNEELTVIWEADSVVEETNQQDDAGISLHAIMGSRSSSTIKIQGWLKNKPISVLVDSGSTHNFIAQSLVKQLRLPVTPCSEFKVQVANGEKLSCSSKIDNIKWCMAETQFEANMNIIPLGGYDMILGVNWMKTVSPITFDFGTGTINIKWIGKRLTLQQDDRCPNIVMEPSAGKVTKSSPDELYFLVQITALEATAELGENAELQNSTSPGIQKLIEQYSDIFKVPVELPPKRSQDHFIPIKPGSKPVHSNPYRCPYFQKEEIEKITREMLDCGVIRNSNSPYASPVLLVKKKDNTWRMVVDYRALNSITIKNKYPIPIIEELLAELQGSTVFTKLDLRSGYHQIRVNEEDVYKTAFKTHNGHYEFLVMPFGLTNAPASFQGLMNEVFSQYLRKFVLVFFDDILVYSKNEIDHEEHLRAIFDVLRSNKLFVKRSKCEFNSRQVDYLGHIISEKGVSADYTKIKAMIEWPQPANIKALRGFLGLTGYYRRFVKNYGIISKPLTQLLKKGAFCWNSEANKAFNQLKTAMSETPVLALPNFEKTFIIETDACKNGVGAVMMQDGRPIAYMSKALSPKHLGLSTYEKEMLAVIMAVQKWRAYLLGHQFIIKTDHEALKYLMEQKITTGLQQKWLSRLLGYDYIITYRKGKENIVADSLSRVYEGLEESTAITVLQPTWKEEICASYDNDSTAQEMLSEISVKGNSLNDFSLSQGILKWKGRYYVGTSNNLRQKICNSIHSNMEGGHSGIAATLKRAEQLFYWPGLKNDITKLVKECEICHRNKIEHVPSPGLLQPIPLPKNAWEVISMDFVEGLPKSKGKDTILVIVDRLTKYCHIIPLSHPFTAATVAQEVLNHVIKLHGTPSAIISDRDPIFVSNFWQELFRAMGTSIKLSTAYHPQTDGQTERVNQCLEMYLRCMTGQKPSDWANWIPMAEWWYNTTFHTSAGMTPYQALYSQSPPSISYQGARCSDPAVTQFVRDRINTQRLLKDNLLKAQERMKFYADKKRTDREFEEGDEVYLKLQPYRQMSVNLRKNHKLAARYYGPYKVIKRIGKVAYKISLPNSSKVHDVFHVLQGCSGGSARGK